MAKLNAEQVANIREALARWSGYSSLENIRAPLEAAAAGSTVRWHPAVMDALAIHGLHASALSIAIDLACIERAPKYRANLATSLRARVSRYHPAVA